MCSGMELQMVQAVHQKSNYKSEAWTSYVECETELYK